VAIIDINAIIILIVLFILYGVFLFFDLFKRNENYGYLAYLVALAPINFLWFLNFDALGMYLVLFILWCICLVRDLWGVKSEKKEINQIVLYLVLAIIIQLILSAILPASNAALQTNNKLFWFFWLPDIYDVNFLPNSWVNLEILFAFRITATLLVILVIIPLLVDIRGEEVPVPVFIIIIGLFVIPFLYLGWIWLPQGMAVLTLLFSVILFIVLLLITRSGKEEVQVQAKKKQ
jgi:hypothetical protein